MKVPSKKVLIGIAIGISILLVVLAILLFRRRSKFQWPPGSSPTQHETSLQTTLQGIQDTYNSAIVTAGNEPTAIATAENARAAAVKTAVQTFIGNSCPDVNAVSRPTSTLANGTAWDNYMTDLRTIQSAYVGILATPAPTGYTTNTNDMVIAARKADIGGATRKYIATVCQNFYKPTSGTDPTTTYAGWNAATGTNAANGGYGFEVRKLLTTAGASATYGASNLSAWAEYAANVYTVDSRVGASLVYTAPAQPTSTITIPIVESLANKGLATGHIVQFTYYVPSTTTGQPPTGYIVARAITGLNASGSTSTITVLTPTTSSAPSAFYIPAGTLVAVGMKNPTVDTAAAKWKGYDSTTKEMYWKKAREYGPGSVYTAAGIPSGAVFSLPIISTNYLSSTGTSVQISP